MNPDQLRSAFLHYFTEQLHTVVASSPVVPEGDPTLLFTNAGMNQFKDVLLGLEKRDYVRAASAQKCIRAGGKHNDLDEVGKDGRHLTFFEMLGNWSFGEYYKRESLKWGWEFVTKVMKLDPARLYVSVYKDDDESWDIWEKELGLAPDHIVRLGDVEAGDEENFWSMGPTGPCGPCSEIYYDNHPEYGFAPWAPGFDGERFLEIWNHVFMEFNRDDSGALTPLPMKSVDTGMGLDRAAAVMAGVDNVFHTGLFAGILERTHFLLTGERIKASELFHRSNFTEYCVIADHVRTVMFSICDGATFANEGRGYVLRRILRRAVRHGRNLGFSKPFLFEVTTAVVEDFSHVYPELRRKQREAQTIIKTEEERFFRTLERGIALFDEVAQAATAEGRKAIAGDDVFKLYDTFGFPPDLTEIMAGERGLGIDGAGYQVAMERQRDRSRSADARYEVAGEWVILLEGAADQFIGYDRLEATTEVLRFRPHAGTNRLDILLKETPFYAESGGQTGDTGIIESADGKLILRVIDTQKTTAGITHIAEVDYGTLSADALAGGVVAKVDGRKRFLSACNHTATHLLHAALHKFVSATAFQAGSLVSSDRLRFDFNHTAPVSESQLREIEIWVNEQILEATGVTIHNGVSIAEAERRGAMMMFGEKYGAEVRMVEIGASSVELCGGTHVGSTRDIAYFRVVSEGGVAAGVRRIEAATNARAFELANEDRALVERLSETLRVPEAVLTERLQKLLAEQSQLEKQLEQFQRAQAKTLADQMVAAATESAGVLVASAHVGAVSRDTLMALADFVRDRMADRAGVALVAAMVDGKPALAVVATDAAVSRGLKAGNLVNGAATHIEGKGGGRPTLAQAGGKIEAGLAPAVAGFAAQVSAALGA
jgi:alanyl-tRNA synthetase